MKGVPPVAPEAAMRYAVPENLEQIGIRAFAFSLASHKIHRRNVRRNCLAAHNGRGPKRAKKITWRKQNFRRAVARDFLHSAAVRRHGILNGGPSARAGA